MLLSAAAFAGDVASVSDPVPVVGKKAVIVPPVVEDDDCPIPCLECGPWRFSADLHQSERNPALFDSTGPNGTGICQADEFDQGYDSGYEFTLQRRISDCCVLEARYLNSSWNASANHGDNATFFTENGRSFIDNTSPSSTGSSSLESDLNGFSFLLKCQVRDSRKAHRRLRIPLHGVPRQLPQLLRP